MNNFFSEFPKSSKLDWEDKLKKELKGLDLKDAFFKNDEIEEFTFSSYVHQDDVFSKSDSPARYPFTRGVSSNSNEWKNAVCIEVNDVLAANSKALAVLMTGADALIFKLSDASIDFDLLLNEISIEYISIHFDVSTLAQYQELNKRFGNSDASIFYRLDAFNLDVQQLIDLKLSNSKPFCFVNAFAIQQAGANIKQELSFALSQGKEFLTMLTNAGLSIEEAVKLIHFDFGVGANYFHEIAKFRAFRKMWAFIVQNYNHPQIDELTINISATVGFVNKSLKDPHTNLLRQTSESMSAIIGGVDMLTILSFDQNSKKGESEFSLRMAQNIPLILKEESYFEKVIDPLGGSYSIEKLTDELVQISWNLFQFLDEMDGVFSSECQLFIYKEVKDKSELKLHAYKNADKVLIGVNKFKNSKEDDNCWVAKKSLFGLEFFNVENSI